MNLGDVTPGFPFKAIVFSPSKLGKTFGAGTFPRPNFMDFDGSGTDTLLSPEFIAAHGHRPSIMLERFRRGKYNDKGALTEANAFYEAQLYFEACMKPKGGTWKGRAVGPEMFDTWVIDTGTTLFDAAFDQGVILLGEANANATLGISSKTHKAALETGLVFAKKQDYGAERSMAEQFIQKVLDSGKHVLLLCHEEEIWDGDGANATVVGYAPLLRGKSKDRVAVRFTEIYRLIGKLEGPEYRRVLQTQRVAKTQVGSRLGIPDNTAWTWAAIKSAIDANAALRAATAPTPIS